MLQYELKRMVNRDIEYCKNEWDEHSFDWERMGALFDEMLNRYADVIDGFDDDLKVINPYEINNAGGCTFRDNIQIIIEKLEKFRDNDFSNDGLNADINSDYKIYPYSREKFDEARLVIAKNEQIDEKTREEVAEKIDEIETICQGDEKVSEKWDNLRPYMMWLSGKNLVIASQIMPLMMMIAKTASSEC